MNHRYSSILLCMLLMVSSGLLAQKRLRPSQEGFPKAEIRMGKESRSAAAIRFAPGEEVPAEDFFENYRKAFPLSDANRFVAGEPLLDQLGQAHYRYRQLYSGIEVAGAYYILHQRGGMVHHANGKLVHNLKIDVNPSLSEGQALRAAINFIDADRYMWDTEENEAFLKREQSDPSATFYPSGRLMLSAGARELVAQNYRLVYRFDIYAESPLGRYVVDVDAANGEIVAVTNRIHEADTPATGTTLYNGAVDITVDSFGGQYRLREAARSGIETYDMQNGTNYGAAIDFTDSDTDFSSSSTQGGVSGHWGAEKTYDYFFTEHGRNSFDDAGGVIRSYVHYSSNYNNAFWDGSRMTYGDGDGTSYTALVGLDVIGHEITHGVTEFSADLVYANESGALNESFSDIFGSAIEIHVEGVGVGDWLIGEDFDVANGDGFRSMSAPNDEGDPDTYFGNLWAPLSSNPNQFNDYGGVHSNSGVQNFWFYLLTEGGSGTNDNGDPYAVTGIGLQDAAAIAYRNLTVYLGTSSGFNEARQGAIDAATDLFGESSAQVQAVKDAWDAVGVYEPVPPEGILVWDGSLTGSDYSGNFIHNYLSGQGFTTLRTSQFPTTMIGYDAVFLSFGNYGSGGVNTPFTDNMAGVVKTYLQAGGKVYIEGGDALGYDQDDDAVLLGLMGISAATDGASASRPVADLQGQSGSVGDGKAFSGSSQSNNNYIDLYTPGSGSVCFVETGLGNVGVEYSGASGQKTVAFSYSLAGLNDGASPSTRGEILDDIIDHFQVTPQAVRIGGTAFLQGPFNGSTMSTALRDAGLLPLDQPFSGAPWNHAGTESVSAMPADVVDWILVKLRSGATASEEVATRAALLLSDGSIVDTDGSSPVTFKNVSAGTYYVVICHRNHLDIMTNGPIALTYTTAPYVFSSAQNQCYGTSPMSELSGGVFGMISGDGNSDNGIDAQDLNTVWRAQNGTAWDYSKRADFDMDGDIDAIDLNAHWRPDNGSATQVPN